VWEEHEEEVDVKMQTHVPVFTEVEEKEIVGDPESEQYNFLLEGDNLHSLKLLEKTHKGKIDVIYIDPPYNTLKDGFTYEDEQVDGNDGFRHSKWLSFMSERLKIARKFLQESGVIFISIDDNEEAQLKLLCDDIFGSVNFVGMILWKKKTNGNNMGYRKKYYLEKRGFTGNTQEYIGYDTEIVKDMAKKGTVKVVKDPDTRVVICDERKKAWKDDYSYYYATKRRWPLAVRLSSDVDFIVESIVYLSAFYFIIQGTLREYSAGIIILTFLIDFIVINVVLKHLGQRKLFLTSFTVNTLGFIFQWYYNFYSIFTAKKWR